MKGTTDPEIITRIIDSPIGNIRISGSSRLISEISFLDSSGPADSPDSFTGVFERCKTELELYFRGELRTFSIPYEQKGTGFQKHIWLLLADIPYGKTWSYSALAKKSGDPKNTRAVGNANGKNNLTIVVPCHRVIGHNGSLTGYAGGMWRKEWLLQHEARVAHGVLELF